MDTPEDFQSWVTRERLAPDVVKALEDHGFTSVDDIKMLTWEDIEEHFKNTGLLKLAHCLQLKKVITSLSQMSLASTDSSAQSCSSTSNLGPLSYQHPSTSSLDSGPSSAPDPTHPQQLGVQLQPEQVCSPLTADGPSAWSLNMGTGGSFAGAEECFRFLLLGKTGSGKSTTGNTIFGEKLFDTSASFSSVTIDCDRKMNRRNGRKIEIIDSPGLYDTHRTHEQICVTIIKAVAGMHPGPHAILYVIGIGRFTTEDYGAYKRLKKVFDDGIGRHLIIVFTHGDMLEQEQKSIQEMIVHETNRQFLQVLEDCKNRYIVFNNKAQNPQLQVEQLLQMVRAMVADNGGKPYSCPKFAQIGEEVEGEVARRLLEVEKRELQRQKYVQQMEKQTKEAEDEAERIRVLCEKNEEERTRQMQEDKAKRDKMEEQLQAQIREQQDNLDRHQQELQRVHQDRQEQERMLNEKVEEMTERERQRAEEMAEKMKQQEMEIKALVEKQKEEVARQEEKIEEKRQQMEQEKRKYMQELMQQRERDKEQLADQEEKQRRLEQQLEQMEQKANKKIEDYERVLEKLKDEISAKEYNINWFEYLENVVNKVLTYFGFLEGDSSSEED